MGNLLGCARWGAGQTLNGVRYRAGRRWHFRLVVMMLCSLPLAGCGLFAAPCRIGSAGLKIVPLVGQVAAAPTDACANVIDSTPTKS